ncbi:hypothetical protein PN451_17700, partial [Dolichospermum planctonicum CS-1226]
HFRHFCGFVGLRCRLTQPTNSIINTKETQHFRHFCGFVGLRCRLTQPTNSIINTEVGYLVHELVI